VLTERDWVIILSGAETVTFTKGDTIMSKGDNSEYFYKIKAGKVRISTLDDKEGTVNILIDSKQYCLLTEVYIILNEGDVFGEMPFFDLPERSDFIAEGPVTLYRIPDRVMHALLQVDPSFSERFFQHVSALRHNYETLLAEIVIKVSYHIHNLPVKSAISKMNDQVCSGC
jgi:CRP-like cAMP-binding protein